MEFKDRLKQARKNMKVSQAKLAEAVGLDQTTISNMEKGKVRSTSKILAIANYLRVNPTWLSTGKGDMTSGLYSVDDLDAGSSNVTGEPFRIKSGSVPVKGAAQLGPGGYFEPLNYPVEEGDGHLLIESRDVDAYGLKVVGSSMMPRIKHHEYVVIEPNHSFVAGDEVLVCTTDGQCMIKVFLWLRDGQYRFDSINDDFEPLYVLEENVAHVHYVGAIVKPSRHMP